MAVMVMEDAAPAGLMRLLEVPQMRYAVESFLRPRGYLAARATNRRLSRLLGLGFGSIDGFPGRDIDSDAVRKTRHSFIMTHDQLLFDVLPNDLDLPPMHMLYWILEARAWAAWSRRTIAADDEIFRPQIPFIRLEVADERLDRLIVRGLVWMLKYAEQNGAPAAFDAARLEIETHEMDPRNVRCSPEQSAAQYSTWTCERLGADSCLAGRIRLTRPAQVSFWRYHHTWAVVEGSEHVTSVEIDGSNGAFNYDFSLMPAVETISLNGNFMPQMVRDFVPPPNLKRLMYADSIPHCGPHVMWILTKYGRRMRQLRTLTGVEINGCHKTAPIPLGVEVLGVRFNNGALMAKGIMNRLQKDSFFIPDGVKELSIAWRGGQLVFPQWSAHSALRKLTLRTWEAFANLPPCITDLSIAALYNLDLYNPAGLPQTTLPPTLRRLKVHRFMALEGDTWPASWWPTTLTYFEAKEASDLPRAPNLRAIVIQTWRRQEQLTRDEIPRNLEILDVHACHCTSTLLDFCAADALPTSLRVLRVTNGSRFHRLLMPRDMSNLSRLVVMTVDATFTDFDGPGVPASVSVLCFGDGHPPDSFFTSALIQRLSGAQICDARRGGCTSYRAPQLLLHMWWRMWLGEMDFHNRRRAITDEPYDV